MTLVEEEAMVARYLPGFDVRNLPCSEFNDAMDALVRILERESPPMTGREAVERDMRRG